MIKKYLIFLTLVFSVYSCTVISEKAAQKADGRSYLWSKGHSI